MARCVARAAARALPRLSERVRFSRRFGDPPGGGYKTGEQRGMIRFRQTRYGLFLLSFVAALLLGAAPAAAHRPFFNLDGTPDPTHPYVLQDVDVSQVIYGGFS